MNDTFNVGVALAIGLAVGTYFGRWLQDAFRAYLVMHSSSTHSWELSPEPPRPTEKTQPEFAGDSGFQALAENCANISGTPGEERKEAPEVVQSR